MTTIQNPPPAFGAQQQASNSNAASSSSEPSTSAQISADFDTFLQMLTVQMQNQDPLNPIESTDFAVQLATFSTVEQQVQTNDLLGGLGSKLDGLGLSQLASWVGMDARANMPAAFDGATPITVYPNPESIADEAYLFVRDDQGRVVSTEKLPLPVDSYQWSGRGANGEVVPAGTYRFDVESMVDGESLSINPAETFDRVTEVRVENGQTVLVTKGGQVVSASDISAIREGA